MNTTDVLEINNLRFDNFDLKYWFIIIVLPICLARLHLCLAYMSRPFACLLWPLDYLYWPFSFLTYLSAYLYLYFLFILNDVKNMFFVDTTRFCCRRHVCTMWKRLYQLVILYLRFELSSSHSNVWHLTLKCFIYQQNKVFHCVCGCICRCEYPVS